jgi:hypothetical protein
LKYLNNTGAIGIAIMIVGVFVWMATYIVYDARRDQQSKPVQVCQSQKEADPNGPAKTGK